MKKTILFTLVFISFNLFYSCSNDDTATNQTVNPPAGNSLSGEWTVNKVQMVQAPSGSSASAIMKQALTPFGEVDASFAGNLDFTIGAELMSSTNMNVNISSYELFFDGSTGYGKAYFNNLLISTSDGGVSWNTLSLPFSYVTGCVYNQNTIYMISTSSDLMKSTNSGVSWNTISNISFSQSNIDWNSVIFFTSDLTGYAISYDKLYKTTNGGVNWNNIFTWSSSSNKSMKFFDDLNGLILDGDTKCKKTTNGGINWTEYSINNSGSIRSWYFLNSNTGWATGYGANDDVLFKTNNGGQTWTQVSSLYASVLKFQNENTGYGIRGEFLLKTTNSGINWQNRYALPSSLYLNSLEIINGEPVTFTNNQILKPSGIIDTTKWVATGNITNSAIKLITHAPDHDVYANGELLVNSNNIVFTSYNYSGGQNVAAGGGTYSFDSGFLDIVLNFANNEKWKVKLKRR